MITISVVSWKHKYMVVDKQTFARNLTSGKINSKKITSMILLSINYFHRELPPKTDVSSISFREINELFKDYIPLEYYMLINIWKFWSNYSLRWLRKIQNSHFKENKHESFQGKWRILKNRSLLFLSYKQVRGNAHLNMLCTHWQVWQES